MVKEKFGLVEKERIEKKPTNEIEGRLIYGKEKISGEVEGSLNLNIYKREGNESTQIKVSEPELVPCHRDRNLRSHEPKQIKVLEPELAPCCEEPNLIPHERGMVCTNCGVVQEQLVFEKPVNASASQSQNAGFANKPKKVKPTPQLSRALKMDRISYEQKTKNDAKSFIFNTAVKLNLSNNQANECLLFFIKLWNKKMNKGIDLQTMMIAAIYTYLKLRGFPTQIKKIIKLYDFDNKKVDKAIKRINKIIQSCSTLRKEWTTIFNDNYPLNILGGIYTSMDFDYKIYNNARRIITRNKCIQKLKSEKMNNPFGLVAGAIYLAYSISKDPNTKKKKLTQELIAEHSNITVVTLRLYYQFLYKLFEPQIMKYVQKTQTATSSTEQGGIMKEK
jgi:transcription initiation factor TFIIIB Brf1 subunit/transcription initiation factor TFIIB